MKIEIKIGYLYKLNQRYDDCAKYFYVLKDRTENGEYSNNKKDIHYTPYPMSVMQNTDKINNWARFVSTDEVTKIGKIEDYPEYFI